MCKDCACNKTFKNSIDNTFKVGDLVTWKQTEISHSIYEGIWEIVAIRNVAGITRYDIQKDSTKFSNALALQLNSFFTV